jgi:hypothetical protein
MRRCSLACALVAQPVEYDGDAVRPYPLIHKVPLRLQDRGRAFRDRPAITAAVGQPRHQACTMQDRRRKDRCTEQVGGHDFSRFDTASGPWLPGRLRRLHSRASEYLAFGHARGIRSAYLASMLTGHRIPDGNMARLIGDFDRSSGAMSGGPIINAETGEVVGTVNAYIGSMARRSVSSSRERLSAGRPRMTALAILLLIGVDALLFECWFRADLKKRMKP